MESQRQNLSDPVRSHPGNGRRTVVFSTYDTPENPFYGGGGAVAIHEVARRLVPRQRVVVVSGAFPGARPRNRDGVEYVVVGSRRAGPKLGQLLFQALLPWSTRHHASDLWIESLTPPFSTACLQRFTRRPVAALTQVLAGEAMRRKYHGLPFDRWERAGLRTYRYGIATSGPTENALRHAHPAMATTIIPNGVPPELCVRPPAPEAGRKHILFLGRIDVEQKGLDLLLDAVGQARPPLACPLVLAGSGTAKDEAWLRQRLAAPELRDRARWVGRAAGTAKEALLDQALCLAMPSRFEAAPLVAVEAWCHAVPVVCFDLPILADLPGSCTLKVPPFSGPALAGALGTLIADRALAARLGAAAKVHCRSFGWDSLTARYEEFFETMRGAR